MTKAAARQDVEQAISRVAVSIYETGFVAARRDDFKPRAGTLMAQLWQHKRLSERQQRAWFAFTSDLYGAAGKSGPIVSGYGDGTRSTNPSEFKAPVAHVNAQYRRLERLVATFTAREERALLGDLIQDELQRRGDLHLERIGLHISGYANADQARSSGTTAIHMVLARIASFYSVA